jgi:hypothetical protein
MQAMRLPSSGPPLGEIPGGPFEGFQLRHIDNVPSLLATNVTTGYATVLDIDSVAATVALPTPQPNRQYSVRCTFGLNTTTDAAARIDILLQGTYDGVTWFTAGGNSMIAEATQENLTGWVDMPATLGSALVTPMPDAPVLVGFRVQVRASEDDVFAIPTATGFGNRMILSLCELV